MNSLPTCMAMILILAAPLGAAGQNVGLGLTLLTFLFYLYKQKTPSFFKTVPSHFLEQFYLIWAVALLPIATATIAKNQPLEALRFLLGHALVSSIFLIGITLRRDFNWKLLDYTASIVLLILAAVSLSQFIFGWQITDFSLAGQIKRAQGFYSHPLTLAYAALAVMPLIVARALANPNDWRATGPAIALLIIIFTSQSVTVMTLTLITLAICAYKLLTRRQTMILILAAAFTGILTVTVPNPVAEKFKLVLSGERSDHETPYLDDRLAFWHAHWEMFLDSPILGHGSEISRDDRKPYYERIGLGGIKRMYEAHNMYLQSAVEGGLVATLGLACFFIWWFLVARNFRSEIYWQRLGSVITPVIFAAGGLTQNAFQDSEVRYLLILTCTACFCLMGRSRTEIKPDH